MTLGVKRWLRAATAVVVAVFATLLIGTPAFAATFPINEPFGGATTNNPNWQFIHFAHLTNEGDGWLQLTDTGNFVDGSAVLDDAFSTSLGVTVDFDYATYGGIELGGNRGDGFSFFLMDGSFPAAVGISGGGLGYTQLQGGYAGIGFDEFGNFSASLGGPGQQPNKIVIRGSYAATPNWAWLTSADPPGGTVETGSRAGVRHVRVVVSPVGGDDFISVFSDSGPGTPLVPVISSFNISTAPGQPPLPPTFKIGFSGSTGGATNFHEIRNLLVNVPTDLRITKTATPVVNPRGQVTYTLTGSNHFINPVTGAVISDVVPAGITNVTWTCTGNLGATCTTPSGSGNNVSALVNFPPDSAIDATPAPNAIVTITGTASDATAGTTITNTAHIAAPADRINLAPTTPTDTTTASASTVVNPFANLSVTKTVTPSGPVEFGGSISYTIGVTNYGPGDATDVVISDPIPAAIDPTTVVAPGCTVAGAQLTCPVGPLAAGASQQFTVTGDILGSEDACVASDIVQTATATSTSTDNVPGDDSASVSNPCTVPVSFTVTKTGPAEVREGGDLTYTVTVTNTGPFAAPDTSIIDEVPAAITDVTWTCKLSTGAECTTPSGTGNSVRAVATIPHGGSAVITINGTASTPGTVTNSVTAGDCPRCTTGGTTTEVKATEVTVITPGLPVTGPPLAWIIEVGADAVGVGLVLLIGGLLWRRHLRRA